MREKIEQEIIDWLKSGNENTTYIAERILLLFSVSGNEAHPKENKKVGEVELPCQHHYIQKDTWWESCAHCGMIKPLGQ